MVEAAANGLQHFLTIQALLYLTLGAAIGLAFGAIPGLGGPTAPDRGGGRHFAKVPHTN